jgi:FtsH-binding integral membrane protein
LRSGAAGTIFRPEPVTGIRKEDSKSMSDYDRGLPRAVPAGATDMAVDAGLRGFMLGVYNKVALGLLLSGLLAYATAYFPPVTSLLYNTDASGRLVGFTVLGTAIRFAPLVMILVSLFAMRNPSPRSAGILYWALVSAIGAGLGVWFLLYQAPAIFMTFLITATAFGGLSLVGYTTKKDLTGFGSFLLIGLFGIIIASLVNMFLHLPAIQFIVNILGVLIFAGLIAYDTQRLKMTYYSLGGNQAAMSVATNYGALSLYLDFINLFQFLLMLFGGGSRR